MDLAGFLLKLASAEMNTETQSRGLVEKTIQGGLSLKNLCQGTEMWLGFIERKVLVFTAERGLTIWQCALEKQHRGQPHRRAPCPQTAASHETGSYWASGSCGEQGRL